MFCPSDTAYGARGAGPIPGNTDLVFDVELFDIR
ncbi:MAG TPA: FKBP-type peptidyl-prolyl cis-trans isomerase [Limnobacter sp.]|nr:FKBP-type peptidyl-prolyl cis-trans isomerase [Limnobacter sp.]